MHRNNVRSHPHRPWRESFPRLLQKSSAELAELLTDKEAFARFLHGTEGALEARAFTRELRLEIEGSRAGQT